MANFRANHSQVDLRRGLSLALLLFGWPQSTKDAENITHDPRTTTSGALLQPGNAAGKHAAGPRGR